jgi:MerR family mercuric resistance operon transcriptional regulator
MADLARMEAVLSELVCACHARKGTFLPADCVTARRNEARCIGAGESRGDYALACFIFRILRRPQVAELHREAQPIG